MKMQTREGMTWLFKLLPVPLSRPVTPVEVRRAWRLGAQMTQGEEPEQEQQQQSPGAGKLATLRRPLADTEGSKAQPGLAASVQGACATPP